MRFSQFFKLRKTQFELDFVDIDLGRDIPLFVDPYAISIPEDEWFVDANNLIYGYFSLVVDTIKNKSFTRSKELLARLGEPHGTYIGLSKSNREGRSGRGIGKDQASELFNKLKKSRAVITGSLTDLSDCELLIPGIGSDKISDITVNIIRGKLAEYTTTQCSLHGIPVQRVATPPYWSNEKQNWVADYHELPIYKNRPVILIPKSIVRMFMTIDPDDFYNKHVLEFLQREHLNAGTSLVRILKNGKRVVYKKDLKEQDEYKMSKEFLYEFTQQHPEVLEQYKKTLDYSADYIRNEELEQLHSDPQKIDIDSLISKLKSIPSGKSNANEYHTHVLGILELLFYPMLRNPRKEEDIHDGRKRIDIVFNNGMTHGFFGDLFRVHQIKSPYIFVECKNYTDDIKNQEFDQLTGRFSPRRGRFGIITCRSIENKSDVINRCRDAARDDRGFVIVLSDEDIANMLEMKKLRNSEGINSLLVQRLREILMN